MYRYLVYEMIVLGKGLEEIYDDVVVEHGATEIGQLRVQRKERWCWELTINDQKSVFRQLGSITAYLAIVFGLIPR